MMYNFTEEVKKCLMADAFYQEYCAAIKRHAILLLLDEANSLFFIPDSLKYALFRVSNPVLFQRRVYLLGVYLWQGQALI
jgi:hypothetical protein